MDKNTLAEIQALVKVPKGQLNKFGNYRYRSAEDIVEAVKLVINPLGYWLVLTDNIVEIAGRFYVEATATLTNGTDVYQSRAFAREEESKKGMDASQLTGATSSYARKYALNGLFAIDDTKDADATNTHEEVDEVGKENRDMLLRLLDSSSYDETLRYKLTMKIAYIKDLKGFEDAKINLLANQLDGTESINPSMRDINQKIKKTLTA